MGRGASGSPLGGTSLFRLRRNIAIVTDQLRRVELNGLWANGRMRRRCGGQDNRPRHEAFVFAQKLYPPRPRIMILQYVGASCLSSELQVKVQKRHQCIPPPPIA
jgi:hypothetical protein